MPSQPPARQQQPTLRLDTAMAAGSPIVPLQYILDEYGTPGGSALATTRYPDISCHLLLLEAKLTMDGGSRTREKYAKAAVIARQALSLALEHNLFELETRAFFYLGESAVINVKRGQQHLIQARQYYTRATYGDEYGTPEAKRAAGRLAELNVMFPTSQSAVSNRSLPFASGSAVSENASPYLGPAQRRAIAQAKIIRGGERIPSFDYISSDSSSVGTGERIPSFDSMSSASPDPEYLSDASTVATDYDFKSSPKLDSMLAMLQSPMSGISPKTKHGLGIQIPKSSGSKTARPSTSPKMMQPSSPLRTAQSPVTSTSPTASQSPSILKQQNAPDRTDKSRSTSVSFTPETKTQDADSPTAGLTHRRKRSSLSISQLQQRSDEALMEEGKSPVHPEF